MPVFSTNRMVVNTVRALLGGWPPPGEDTYLGNNGSISFHSSSGNNLLAMPFVLRAGRATNTKGHYLERSIFVKQYQFCPQALNHFLAHRLLNSLANSSIDLADLTST